LAMNLIPMLAGGGSAGWQANTQVAVVVVEFVRSAIQRSVAALAPRFFPVLCRIAGLWVALTGTHGSIPVESSRAGLGSTVAATGDLVPEVAWQAVDVLLDTTARADVEAPVDSGVSVSGTSVVYVSVAVDREAAAAASPLVPVGRSQVAVGIQHVVANFVSASALAS